MLSAMWMLQIDLEYSRGLALNGTGKAAWQANYETDALAKIDAGPQIISTTAEIIAQAYVACSLDAGPAALMLSAAIEADAEVREIGRAFQSEHAAPIRAAAPLNVIGSGPVKRYVRCND
jgi:hypothetical protein